MYPGNGGYFDLAAYMPVDWLSWAAQLVPIAIGIWLTRAPCSLTRGRYILALAWRAVVVFVPFILVQIFLITRVIWHDPASDTPAVDFQAALLTINASAHAAAGLLLARPLVRRLRDAGIEKKWAYLAVLPYIDLLMFAGLLFYPPSKPVAEPAAPAVPQT